MGGWRWSSLGWGYVIQCQVTWGGGGHHLDEGYVMRCQVTWGGGGHHLDEGYVM